MRRIAPLCVVGLLGCGALRQQAPARSDGGLASARGRPGAPLCALVDPDLLDRSLPGHGPVTAGSLASRRPALRVHYCHERLRALAQRVLAHAVRSYRVQVGQLGFPAPLPDGARGGGPELDIYLLNLGRSGRAQANDEPAAPSARTAPGYVVIDYRTPERDDFLASYVAHEMHHVLQYALSRRANAALLEAVAAYVDDRLYPRAGILPAMVADFQRAPHWPLYHHDEQSCYDYGAALFIGYLAWRHGLGLVREVLARAEEDHLPALAERLAARGSSLEDAAREFARLRTRTGRYGRGSVFPGAERFPEVALERAVSPFELSSGELSLRPERAPRELGSVYLGLDLTTPMDGGLAVEVEADAGPGLLSVDLVGSDDATPLAGALLRGGEARRLEARALRPGMRLWLVVTNLGQGPLRLQREGAATAHGFSARLRRLPEPP